MINDSTLEIIRQQKPYFLEEDKQNKGYVCPACGNGTGKTGDGIRLDENNKTHYKCFKCGLYEDIVGLYQRKYNSDFRTALNEIANHYGISLNDERSPEPTRKETIKKEPDYKEISPQDLTNFITQANENITQTDYLENRGISKATIDRFKIGYCKEWTHPRAENAIPTERLIIPTSEHSYNARALNPAVDDKYKYMKYGKASLFNLKALDQTEKPVFIVEGEIDALSFAEAGAEAIALGGVTNTKILLEAIKSRQDVPEIIIALDNDEAGQKASDELLGTLQDNNILAMKANLYADNKDGNESLLKDKEIFTETVSRYNQRDYIKDKLQKERLGKYKSENSNFTYLNLFLKELKEIDNPPTETGFNWLDSSLGGGLYPGLIAIGAISSLGKTTFALQIGDKIAQNGKDVYIFSLEMSRNELISKSISRNTFEICLENNLPAIANNGKIGYAKTAIGITDTRRREYYTDEEHKLIDQAIMRYAKYSGNLYVNESVGQTSVSEIRELVKTHTEITGNAPVVIVDYLQILGQEDPKHPLGDKQKADEAVMLLKQLSRDFKTPVIVISSFNRESYTAQVSMKSFKESGGIEYSADVLLGLQYSEVSNPERKGAIDLKKESSKNPREIEVVILKNRNGMIGETISFNYYPAFNYFCEWTSISTMRKLHKLTAVNEEDKNEEGTEKEGMQIVFDTTKDK